MLGEYWDWAIQVAIFTVGVTSMVKQLLNVKNAKLKVLLTILVGAVGAVLLAFLPVKVFLTVLGISMGVVFYDAILKLIENVLKGAQR